MKVIHERGPFRYTDNGVLENGCGDFRLQEKDFYTKKYHDIYLFDNSMQMFLAIEDFEYTKWLAGHSCYVKDVVKAPIYDY
mgnify:CR=1 FL=1